MSAAKVQKEDQGRRPSIELDVVAKGLPAADLPVGIFEDPLPGTIRLVGRSGKPFLLTPAPRKNTLIEQILAVSILASWFL